MSGTPTAILLANNENPLGPSPRAVEAMGRAAAAAHRYPDPDGRALKEGIAGRLGVPVEGIALGNGSNELIELLVRQLVGPGDEVVVSRPTFVMYGLAARRAGGVLVEVPGHGLAHDLGAMRAAIGPRTRLVFVCNPNNPTGTLVGATAWRDFVAALPPGVVVASDEAYRDYAAEAALPATLDDVRAGRAVVVLRTFSKVHGLAGAWVGYALTTPGLAAGFERVHQPYNVNAVAQAGALAALDDHAHVARSRAVVRAGQAFLFPALERLGLAVEPSHANFLCVDLGREAAPLCAALAGRGIQVRDLAPWGAGRSRLRITIGIAAENARLVEALAAALAAPPAGVA